MKKVAFIFILISCTSLVAAASNEMMVSPGDPKKEQDKQPTFTLAKGYFSWFSIFSVPAAHADTFRVVTPTVVPKSTELKK